MSIRDNNMDSSIQIFSGPKPNPFCHIHRGSKGFTLMEVLVATAITGIAIGVVMSLLAQGHSQAYRGDVSRVAAAIATRLIDDWQAKGHYPSSEKGELDGFPGWSYRVEAQPLATSITLPSGEVKEVEPEKLVVVDLLIDPPGKGPELKLAMWVPKAMVEY